MPTTDTTLDQELAGLDHLELHEQRRRPVSLRLWATLWPKLAAIGLVLATWELAVWREWRPRYLLPSPSDVGARLGDDLGTAELWRAVGFTMRRAVLGFALALLIGAIVGLAVSQVRTLRVAVGSLITGLQTMPSIAWFPLAILLFKLSEQAIMFVVVLGAAPSIANGIISGIDHVPPILRKVGTSMGGGTVSLYRDFIIPASLPSTVSGLKQGWAFSWRSLMAGELLVVIPGTQSLGTRLAFARELSDSTGVIATMMVILVIGIAVDSLVFGRAERVMLRRRGLLNDEAPASKLRRRRDLVAATVLG